MTHKPTSRSRGRLTLGVRLRLAAAVAALVLFGSATSATALSESDHLREAPAAQHVPVSGTERCVHPTPEGRYSLDTLTAMPACDDVVSTNGGSRCPAVWSFTPQISVRGDGDGGVNVRWHVPAVAVDRHCPAQGYQVTLTELAPEPGSDTRFFLPPAVDGLHLNAVQAPLVLKVRAVNDFGWGPWGIVVAWGDEAKPTPEELAARP